MKRIFALITLVLLSVTMLFAHGDEKHVMGTVIKKSGSSITVKDMKDKSTDVAITSTTKFMKGNKAVTADDVKEGDRIVVHAKQNGDKLEATMVKVGATNMDHMKSGRMKGMDVGTAPK